MAYKKPSPHRLAVITIQCLRTYAVCRFEDKPGKVVQPAKPTKHGVSTGRRSALKADLPSEIVPTVGVPLI